MQDGIKLQATGHLKITDKDSGEVLVDKHNAIHYGNISTEIAQAMIGTDTAFLEYLAFGDGASITDGAGVITYRAPNVSTTKSPSARPYSINLVVQITNKDTSETPVATTEGSESTVNYEDISMTIELGPSDANGLVFDEMALFSGPHSQDNDAILSALPADSEIRMLTHIIFHPIEKSANRTFTITYTIRIQMGD